MERAHLLFAGLSPMVARFLDDAIALRSDAVVVDRVPQPQDLFSASALTRTDVVLMSAKHVHASALIERLMLSTAVEAVLLLSVSGDSLSVYHRHATPREMHARTASQIVDEAVAAAGVRHTDAGRDHGRA